MSDLPGNSSQMRDVRAGTVEMRCYERDCGWVMQEPADNIATATRRLAKEYRAHYQSVHTPT